MPVQINEVIIRTIVDPVSASNTPPSTSSSDGGGDDYDAVEKVLEIIKEKNER